MIYTSLNRAAKHVGTTRTSLVRAAIRNNVGVRVDNRIVGITLQDAEELRKDIHDRPGRPKRK